MWRPQPRSFFIISADNRLHRTMYFTIMNVICLKTVIEAPFFHMPPFREKMPETASIFMAGRKNASPLELSPGPRLSRDV